MTEQTYGPWVDADRRVMRRFGETGQVQEMGAEYANALEAKAQAAELLEALCDMQEGRALRLPDRGNLLDWLWEELRKAEAKARVAEGLLAALEALAKVQYDGTVEGLRHQIETEDWGDVLDITEAHLAYELTLAAIAQAHAAGVTAP